MYADATCARRVGGCELSFDKIGEHRSLSPNTSNRRLPTVPLRHHAANSPFTARPNLVLAKSLRLYIVNFDPANNSNLAVISSDSDH